MPERKIVEMNDEERFAELHRLIDFLASKLDFTYNRHGKVLCELIEPATEDPRRISYFGIYSLLSISELESKDKKKIKRSSGDSQDNKMPICGLEGAVVLNPQNQPCLKSTYFHEDSFKILKETLEEYSRNNGLAEPFVDKRPESDYWKINIDRSR